MTDGCGGSPSHAGGLVLIMMCLIDQDAASVPPEVLGRVSEVLQHLRGEFRDAIRVMVAVHVDLDVAPIAVEQSVP